MGQEPEQEQTSGDLINSWLAKRRLSWSDLSRRSRISITHLRKIRNGYITQPSASTLHRIAEALELDYRVLLPTVPFLKEFEGARKFLDEQEIVEIDTISDLGLDREEA